MGKLCLKIRKLKTQGYFINSKVKGIKYMKTLTNGKTVEILKTYKNASHNSREINYKTVYYDLLKVRYSDGKEDVICSSEIQN